MWKLCAVGDADTEKFEIGSGSKYADKVQNLCFHWAPKFAVFTASFLVVTVSLSLSFFLLPGRSRAIATSNTGYCNVKA